MCTCHMWLYWLRNSVFHVFMWQCPIRSDQIISLLSTVTEVYCQRTPGQVHLLVQYSTIIIKHKSSYALKHKLTHCRVALTPTLYNLYTTLLPCKNTRNSSQYYKIIILSQICLLDCFDDYDGSIFRSVLALGNVFAILAGSLLNWSSLSARKK